MERSNQPPNTECCRQEGQVGAALEAALPNDRAEAYTGKIMGRKQDSHPAQAIQLAAIAFWTVWRTTQRALRLSRFEFYWTRSRRGKPMMGRRTAPKRLRRGVANFTAWIRENRHEKLPRLLKGLASKNRGTWNYYGVREIPEAWNSIGSRHARFSFKWRNRRSQKRSYTQRAFTRLLKRCCIPTPSIKECAPLANEPNPAIAEAALNQLFRRYDAPKACA
jgi:predicted alpha/beta-hydrolase family hydrolase